MSKSKNTNDSSTGFNPVASDYTLSTPPIPSEYLQLLQNTFKLENADRVIDLGCGSGLLTFGLRSFSHKIEGLDESTHMIELAKQLDTKTEVAWICKPIQAYSFSQDFYSLIISFEAFHLFPDQHALIKRIHHGLKKGGSFCIGWCIYHWEEELKSIIVETFSHFGISWGEWGYQACPYISKLLRESGLSFTELRTDSVAINTTAEVATVAKFLSCINKALVLKQDERDSLCKLLQERFSSLLHSEFLYGNSTYFLSYVSKLS